MPGACFARGCGIAFAWGRCFVLRDFTDAFTDSEEVAAAAASVSASAGSQVASDSSDLSPKCFGSRSCSGGVTGARCDIRGARRGALAGGGGGRCAAARRRGGSSSLL